MRSSHSEVRHSSAQRSSAQRSSVRRVAQQMVEALEQRQHLASNPYATGNTPVFKATTVDTTDVKHGPLAKGGTGLINIYREYKNFVKRGGGTKFTSSYADLYQVRGKFVGVTIRTRGALDSLTSVVREMGGTVQYRSPSRKVIVATVPISQVDDLVARKEVMHVRPLLRPITHSVGVLDNAAERSQKNNLITSAFGATGEGQQVGVISDSFDAARAAAAALDPTLGPDTGIPPEGQGPQTAYQLDVQTQDLAAGVDVLGDDPTGSDEGRAMTQLVHDLAPDAALSFHTRGTSSLEMADAVTALGENGATIMVDDITFFDEPFFQPGVIDKAISDVVDDGVVYLTSAGNYGASGYQSPTPFVQDDNGEKAVDFDPSSGVDTHLGVHFEAAGPVYFQWDNAYDGVVANVTADLDVYLYRKGALIASSLDDNFATGVPSEMLMVPDSGDCEIVVREHALAKGASDPTVIKMVGVETFNGSTDVEYTSATSSAAGIGHEVSRDVIVVGAVPYDATNPYGRVRSIASEEFSGVSTVIQAFDASGNRLKTPAVYPGAIVSGVDGTSTTVLGFAPFFGTSAAAPNVAGLVAQLRDISPDATPAEIRDALIASAKNNPVNDALDGGLNAQAGYGLVDAVAAAHILNANVPVATFDLPTTHAGQLGSVTVTFSEPVTGVDIGDFALTKDGTSKNRFSGTETVRPAGDGKTYVIENLGSATKTLGAYTLSLLRSRTGITDADGNSAAGQVESFAVTLRRVQDLAVRKLDDGLVKLTFTDTNTGEDGYRIQRATDPDFTTDVTSKSISAGVTAYTDDTVQPGEIYYYRVRGVKDGRLGDPAVTSIANGSAGEIFLDNADAKFSGNWETFDRDSSLLGSYARTTSTNELAKPKTATFSTSQIVDGNYFLYVRFNASDKNASNATFEVYRGTKLAKSVRLDQTQHGHGWVLLGGFINNGAQPLSVRLTSKLADGAVNVDAVRFLPADEATVANYKKKHGTA